MKQVGSSSMLVYSVCFLAHVTTRAEMAVAWVPGRGSGGMAMVQGVISLL